MNRQPHRCCRRQLSWRSCFRSLPATSTCANMSRMERPTSTSRRRSATCLFGPMSGHARHRSRGLSWRSAAARTRTSRESADVNVGNSTFGVKVVAAKFESADAQERSHRLLSQRTAILRRGHRVPGRRGLPGASGRAVRCAARSSSHRRFPARRRPRRPATHRLGEAARRTGPSSPSSTCRRAARAEISTARPRLRSLQ